MQKKIPVTGFLFAMLAWPVQADEYSRLRSVMVSEVEVMTLDTSTYTGVKKLDPRVMNVLGKVPRHEFVPRAYRSYAYLNRPLPIGNDQTISQPYIVALMTHLAGVDEDSVVLEIGTGSGYQAAILAELVKQVYTIEIVEPLGRNAKKVLQRLGYDNVQVRIGDGYAGWPEQAPFDAILVTAAPEQVPEPLIAQLKPGGKLVVPVGPQGRAQSLRVIGKNAAGELYERDILPVGFVPLTRGE